MADRPGWSYFRFSQHFNWPGARRRGPVGNPAGTRANLCLSSPKLPQGEQAGGSSPTIARRTVNQSLNSHTHTNPVRRKPRSCRCVDARTSPRPDYDARVPRAAVIGAATSWCLSDHPRTSCRVRSRRSDSRPLRPAGNPGAARWRDHLDLTFGYQSGRNGGHHQPDRRTRLMRRRRPRELGRHPERAAVS